MDANIVNLNSVEDKIIVLRGYNVLIDTDVAKLYGVETKRINEAVKNNPEKFPKGYILEMTDDEKREVVENFDHLEKLKYSPALPKAFTDKGLYMLATILKSDKATQTTIAIVETFAKVRELSRTLLELSESNNEFKRMLLMHKSGEIMAGILEENREKSDIELTSFGILNFKHIIKRKSDD